MQKLKLDDWVVMQRRRKWRWARKLAMTPDFDWMAMASKWDPTVDIHMNARRRQGRPKTRWGDDLASHVQQITSTDPTQHSSTTNTNSSNDDNNMMMFPMPVDNRLWQQVAQDEAAWEALEEGYCHH